MQLKNDQHHYGAVAMTLHWLVALIMPAMFALGLWMTSLTYYNEWYQRGPLIHKGVGILLFVILLFRLFWRFVSPPPAGLSSYNAFEKLAGHTAHILLYLLLFLVLISGYLISTADGRPLEFFGLLELPALIYGFEDQEDIAGDIHLYSAYCMVGLVALHATAALKHHFIDKDRTLLRMLGR